MISTFDFLYPNNPRPTCLKLIILPNPVIWLQSCPNYHAKQMQAHMHLYPERANCYIHAQSVHSQTEDCSDGSVQAGPHKCRDPTLRKEIFFWFWAIFSASSERTCIKVHRVTCFAGITQKASLKSRERQRKKEERGRAPKTVSNGASTSVNLALTPWNGQLPT